MSKFVLNSLSQ